MLTVDGRRVALRPAGRATIAHPEGQGGLRTTRVELPLSARGRRRRGGSRCATARSPGRVGWKAIVAAPGQRHRGALERRRPSDPTNGLRTYPADLLKSPSDVRDARLDASARRRAR